MTNHDHTTRVPGCFRCETSADEAAPPHIAAEWDALTETERADVLTWAANALPIPADDDAQCPRCGCPTACPEGRIEALSAELAEAQSWRENAEITLTEDVRYMRLVEAERDALRAELAEAKARLGTVPPPFEREATT